MSQDLSVSSEVTIQSASSIVNNKEIENTRESENPMDGFVYFVEKCTENYNLIPVLASHLNYSSAWLVCRKLFAAKHLDQQFVEAFYTRFLPVYLKRAYSWLTTHLLIRARTAYPEEFKKLLRALITSTEVPKEVLNDYIANVNDEKRNEFMKVICLQRLTGEQFKYHLTTINFAFLGSEKNTQMCHYIVGHLLLYSSACYNNKEYGKLLLSFLQNYRRYPINRVALTKLVDAHVTEFKSPCLAIIDDIIKALREREIQRARLNNNLSKIRKFEEDGEECSRSIL